MLDRWATWAEAEVEGWAGTGAGEAVVSADAWAPTLPSTAAERG